MSFVDVLQHINNAIGFGAADKVVHDIFGVHTVPSFLQYRDFDAEKKEQETLNSALALQNQDMQNARDLVDYQGEINESLAQSAYERDREARLSQIPDLVESYRRAGLNPYLAYQNSGTSISSPTASVSSPTYSPIASTALSGSYANERAALYRDVILRTRAISAISSLAKG